MTHRTTSYSERLTTFHRSRTTLPGWSRSASDIFNVTSHTEWTSYLLRRTYVQHDLEKPEEKVIICSSMDNDDDDENKEREFAGLVVWSVTTRVRASVDWRNRALTVGIYLSSINRTESPPARFIIESMQRNALSTSATDWYRLLTPNTNQMFVQPRSMYALTQFLPPSMTEKRKLVRLNTR